MPHFLFKLADFIDRTPDWVFVVVLIMVAIAIVTNVIQSLLIIFSPKHSRDKNRWAKLNFATTAAVSGIIVAIKFLLNKLSASEIADGRNRVYMCFSFLWLAAVYIYVSDRVSWVKGVAGVLKIVGALASNYIQLGKYAADPKGQGTFDRWTFIIGGIFVLTSGVKDLYEISALKKAA